MIEVFPKATKEQLNNLEDVCAICFQVVFHLGICVVHDLIFVITFVGNESCKTYPMRSLLSRWLSEKVAVCQAKLSALPQKSEA